MRTAPATLAIVLLAALSSFCHAQPAPQKQALPAASPDAKKTLIPHAAWNCGLAEGLPQPAAGTLAFMVEMKLDQVYDVGETPFGQRQAFVVQGGDVKGEKIQGTVMPLGLDLELTLANGVIEVEQVFVFRTSDNKYIYMRNAGVGANRDDIRVVMDIEAPNNSTAAWLNTGKYVAKRTVDPKAKMLTMAVYDVSAVTPSTDAAQTVKITKPAGVPEQPWDYRKKAATEKQGDVIVTENVTLAGSQSVGASKRGNRNVIPITGGTLTGMIAGKVLPGGADYQNFSGQPTIDARYLWQSDAGDVIIVRNTGGFGGLVPTFEANVKSKYAWLNTGKYLSSSPGPGQGGVSLTFYKSVE